MWDLTSKNMVISMGMEWDQNHDAHESHESLEVYPTIHMLNSDIQKIRVGFARQEYGLKPFCER